MVSNIGVTGFEFKVARLQPRKQLRLGFLARVLVRLERHHQPERLRVVFKFAKSDTDFSTIFDLPFEEVDTWWTNVLQAATALTPEKRTDFKSLPNSSSTLGEP